jgi:predicted phosphoribosyltransferase
MAERLFRDRRDAGRVLAGLLERYRGRDDVIVLGLPRGGVPVAYEVAMALGAPLDVFVVRKLGVPGREEVAMGAIASGGVIVLNDDVVRGLGIGPEVVREVAEREGRELLRRERAYREGRPMPPVAGRTVILVDDGLATGASMRAAIQALRRLRPARIVVAVPAAPESTCRELAALVDEVVCATTPSPFLAVGQSYWDFAQTTDEEVRDLLRAAATTRPAGAGARGPTEVDVLRAWAMPVSDGAPHDDALFDLVGDAEFVLLGQASHGTHEFYAARASMTRRLIEEKGFCAVAAEADWPDAYRVNRYVRGAATTPPRRRRCGASSASPPGCGATRWCSTSSAGCATTTTASAATSGPRPASTDWTCTACTGRSGRSSPTWSGSTRPRRRTPASGTPASTTPRVTTARPTASPPPSGRASRASGRRSSSSPTCSGTRWTTPGGTG